MDNKEILAGLANNDVLMQAVRGLLEEQFSLDKLVVTDSDELLGQAVRARLVGLDAIDDAFRAIAQHKSVPPGVDKVNPAK